LDILKLGLEFRSRITIVPQDPILFSGTIRQNLDPFDEKSDEECQWALDKVHINKHLSQQESNGGGNAKKAVSKTMTIELRTKVAAGGSNFSAGQSQLISLARALLRDARIVLLDEATSSTDFETDSAIQQSIREMQQSIIIAVAHRLTTVIDYDRVLVLSKGSIVEYDTPRNLLGKADDDASAHFKSLCKEAGPIVYRKLCQAAGLDLDVQ
jgi:ABC-type multidrug transport system fused ATPase/permease subunit